MRVRPSIFILVLLHAFLNSGAQDGRKEKEDQQKERVQKMILSKRFVFIAQSVSPTGGPTRQLTSTYTLKVLQDTVISDLPYFGRVYQPSIGSSDGGIKFISHGFEYTAEDRKRGGWDITIKTNDVRNSPRVYLTISGDGNTTTRVSSTDRQAISYYGHIESPNKR
jgi:hypothetical protein